MKGMTNASPGVGQFAAGKLGTIKGGTADGSVQAQEDGTGAVVGWSGKASVASVTALQNATKVAVSEFAITETADKVTITTTAIDGATSKSEDIPAVTDTMAGIITADWFKKLKELWNDAHPATYTLNLQLSYFSGANDISVTVNGVTKSYTKMSGTTKSNIVTFTGLVVGKPIEILTTYGYSLSVYFEIISKSPSTLVTSAFSAVSDSSTKFTVTNPTSESATIVYHAEA